MAKPSILSQECTVDAFVPHARRIRASETGRTGQSGLLETLKPMITISFLTLIALSGGWIIVIMAAVSRCHKCRDWCCDEDECKANREKRLV